MSLAAAAHKAAHAAHEGGLAACCLLQPHKQKWIGLGRGATSEGLGWVRAGRRLQQANSTWSGNSTPKKGDQRWGTALANCSTCHMQISMTGTGGASVEKSAGMKLRQVHKQVWVASTLALQEAKGMVSPRSTRCRKGHPQKWLSRHSLQVEVGVGV